VPRPTPDQTDLLAELAGVYRDADALYAGWSCPASTECCRFGVTGREPYVTSIEVAAVKKAIAARGGMRSWKRGLPVVSDERRCPLLDAAGRCAVYAARPLGCRTFFCDRAEAGDRVRQREVNTLVRRIQDIAARHEPGGDQGRPLTRTL
jgi:uncharacterized protein